MSPITSLAEVEEILKRMLQESQQFATHELGTQRQIELKMTKTISILERCKTTAQMAASSGNFEAEAAFQKQLSGLQQELAELQKQFDVRKGAAQLAFTEAEDLSGVVRRFVAESRDIRADLDVRSRAPETRERVLAEGKAMSLKARELAFESLLDIASGNDVAVASESSDEPSSPDNKS